MKAIDIIKAMTDDSALAECGDVHTYYGDRYATVEDWIATIFGDFHVISGEIEPEDYLAVWSCNSNRIYPFDIENEPDVVLERNNPEEYDEDDLQIYLWTIR